MPLLMRPIPPRPHLGTEVYQALRSHVAEVAQAAAAPVRLREEDLARSLGVSRTPVREALRQLAREGLITLLPRRGAKIVPLSLQEYLDWLDVREMLEGMAARVVAEKSDKHSIAQLRALFDHLSPEGIQSDREAYGRANAAFHARLIALADNPVLTRVWSTYDHMAMVELRLIERTGRGNLSSREHHSIIDALKRSEPEIAEERARAHIRSLKASVAEQLTAIREEP